MTEEKYIPDLDPKTYGLKEDAMNKEVFVDGVFGINKIKLGELIQILENWYRNDIVISETSYMR